MVQSTDNEILECMSHEWAFFMAGNIIKKASISDIEIKITDPSTGPIRKMIEVDSGVVIPE